MDIVTITLRKEDETKNEYSRSVKRSENKLGKFERLRKELEIIALEFGRDVDEVLMEFSEAGCSKKALI